MKHCLIALALIVMTVTTSVAGNRLTKSENDAAMNAGRKEFAIKLSELQKNIGNNTPGVDMTSSQVLQMMQKGMLQVNNEINLSKGEDQKVFARKYATIEKVVHVYTKLSKEPRANGKQLVEQAQAFLKLY